MIDDKFYKRQEINYETIPVDTSKLAMLAIVSWKTLHLFRKDRMRK